MASADINQKSSCNQTWISSRTAQIDRESYVRFQENESREREKTLYTSTVIEWEKRKETNFMCFNISRCWAEVNRQNVAVERVMLLTLNY